MSTNFNELEHRMATLTHNAITASVNTLDTRGIDSPATADTPSERLQRLAKVYVPTRPLLALVSALAIIPVKWREALRLLIAVLDDVTAGVPPAHTLPIAPKGGVPPEADPDFKAGKDI